MLEMLKTVGDLVGAYKARSRQLREDAIADREITIRVAAIDLAAKRLGNLGTEVTPRNLSLVLASTEHFIRHGKVLGD